MIGGQAVAALAVMWSLFGLICLFVALRLYTRICIVRSPGWDDWVYCLSAVREPASPTRPRPWG
jgi:hypothetical protein